MSFFIKYFKEVVKLSIKSLIPENGIAYKGYVGRFAEFGYAYVIYMRFFNVQNMLFTKR